MTITKVQNQLSDRAQAENNGALWLRKKQQADKLKAEMKELEEQLLRYAEKHKADFQGKKTLTLGDVKLKWEAETKLAQNKTVNLTAMYKEFPELISLEPSVSKIKGYLVNDDLRNSLSKRFGVELVTRDKFKVEPK